MRRVRLLFILLGLMCGSVLCFADSLQNALKSSPVKSEGFVRIPVDYIVKKLADEARMSGNGSLASFSISFADSSIGSRRVSIELENMSLYEAIDTVARSVGLGVEYADGNAVLKDPSLISAVPIEPEEKIISENAASSVVPVSEPEEKTKKIKEKSKSFSFADIANALVFVEVDDGRGSGFIARMENDYYVLSNQHNFLGAVRPKLKAMNGKELKPVLFEYSKSRDMVRFKLNPSDIEGLTALEIAASAPQMNQTVIVYGNSAGGGVATELKGTVLGIGPSEVEISAEIVPGNSGSPVINSLGEVVGVATYGTFERKFDRDDQRKDLWKGSRFKDVRRFSVRVPASGWVKCDFSTFLEQTYKIEDLTYYLRSMYVISQYWNGNEDFYSEAEELISYYTGNERRGKPPYVFHDKKTGAFMRLSIQSFVSNHNEWKKKLRDLSVTKKELKKLMHDYDGLGSSSMELIDSRIRTTLISRVELVRRQLEKQTWRSAYIRQESEYLEDLSDALLRLLDKYDNPYERIYRML